MNNKAEEMLMKLGRKSRRGRCVGQILKYSYRITCLEMEEPVNICYDLIYIYI
jgi:hypothetical protein